MAKTIVFEVEVDESGAVKSLGQIDKSIDSIKKGTEDASKGTKKFGTSFGSILKGAGIVGLLVTAFEVLKDALFSNQKVMDAVAIATTSLGIVFNDLFSFVGDNFLPAFEKVKKFFNDLTFDKIKKAIQENLTERFESLLDTIGYVGDAVKKFFQGDWEGAMDSAAKAGKEYVDVLTGVNNSVDKVTDAIIEGVDAVTEYAKETYNAADAIVQAEKSLVTLENTQTRVREKADRDAEKQRQIRDDDTKSIDDRIAANDRLAKILDDQQIAELAAVDAQIAALRTKLKLDSNNQELKNEIFKLETERFAVEAQQEGFRSEQQTNANSLLREKADIINELNLIGASESEQAIINAELEYEKNIELINKTITDEEEKNRILLANKEQYLKAIQDVVDSDAAKSKAKRDKEIEDDKKAEQEKAANKVKFAQLSSQGLQVITDLLNQKGDKDSKEAFERNKKFSVGQALINTALSVTAALTAGGNPLKLATGAQFVEAALASVIGLASVRQIGATQYQGSSASASSGVKSAASAPPPQFTNNTQETGLNQLGDTITSSINNKPVKAYVVANDVTNQQQLDRQTRNNTTL